MLSEFNELIKKFDKIRDYMRDFYVFGFKSREDFDKKSLRSYDNERRRIESYLSDYMSFSNDESGKNIFIEADCCDISANPLYRAFKAKSFTKNDITLHFIILDILVTCGGLSASDVADQIASDYLTYFENPTLLDVSTVRGKLSEYETLGLLSAEKVGKKILYALNNTQIDLNGISDALIYFSETSPIGVVGGFLLDKTTAENDFMRFKHHYIMHALESEVVYELLQAMKNQQEVTLINVSRKNNILTEWIAIPLKILIGVQSGRRYICVKTRDHGIKNMRLDYVKSVIPMDRVPDYQALRADVETMLASTWGSSFGDGKTMQTLKMTLHIPAHERFVLDRIQREGRHGTIEKIEDDVYEYSIDVYDTTEMMPWVRTFIGRIVSLGGTNKRMIQLFHDDMKKMNDIYGGDDHGVL